MNRSHRPQYKSMNEANDMKVPVKPTGKTLCEVFAAELKKPEAVFLTDDVGTMLCCPECKRPLVKSGAKDYPYRCPEEDHFRCGCAYGIFSADYLSSKLGYVFGPTKAEAMAELHAPSPNKASQISNNPKDAIGDTKPDLSLIPSAMLIETAGVMGLGARKYGPYNWRENKVRARVYIAAAQRHLLQYLDGDDTDIESGFSHLAHAAACCGIVLDAAALDRLVDDRPIKGAATALLTKHTKKKS